MAYDAAIGLGNGNLIILLLLNHRLCLSSALSKLPGVDNLNRQVLSSPAIGGGGGGGGGGEGVGGGGRGWGGGGGGGGMCLGTN